MGKLIIENIHKEIKENYVYLYADISIINEKKVLWYRFSKEYEKYICEERSDAFIIGLFYFSLINGYDIETKIPMSEKLLFQLKNYYIPMLAGTTDFFNHIEINAPFTDEKITNEGAVGTALSCGVDSFYTILKGLNSEFEKYKVTHVLFTDIPATIYSDSLRKKWLEENADKSRKVSKELGLKFILCETNLNIDFAIVPFFSKNKTYVANEGLASLQYCSSVFALQKLFSVYYLGSAGAKLNEVDINASPYDVLWHDFYSMPNITTENLQFYSSGTEVSRIEKVNYIADFKTTQKYLFACAMPKVKNCGKCEKCVRTMAELYALNKLENFKEVYPIEDFKKHYVKNIAIILTHRKKFYNRDILEQLVKSGYKIPILSYPLSTLINIKEFFRSKLRDNQFARNIYFNLGLDVKEHGFSTREIRGNDKSLQNIVKGEKRK